MSTNKTTTPGRCLTLKKVALTWLYKVKAKSKLSTYVKYKNVLKCHVLPRFGGKPPQGVNKKRLEGFISSLLKRGGRSKLGLSSKTVADIVSVIRSVLRYAEDRGLRINKNIFKIRIQRQTPKKKRILTRLEQNTIVHFCQNRPDMLNIGILFSLFMGLRVGELCALQWQDISFSTRTVSVDKTMQRIQNPSKRGGKTKIIITEPKSTSSIRQVPIPNFLFELLQGISPELRQGYFLSGYKTDLVEPRLMQYRFQSLLRKCSLEPANFHALRHTFATRCVELGFDIKSLSEILGHSSVALTMNLYVHPPIELKQAGIERLARLFIQHQQIKKSALVGPTMQIA